jgi:L-cysteine/cystine lyase
VTHTDKIALVRASIPVIEEKVYLNAGSVGPLAGITAEILMHSTRRELEQGRSSYAASKVNRQSKADLRQGFARLVKASPGEIALTHHTTEGMNIVVHGLTWQPGDEIITTDLEHPGGLFPLHVVRQRQGVVVKVVKIPPDSSTEQVIARFEAAITPRTRLLAFSHVAWNTGMRLPLAEIVALARQHHLLVLVDGAQSAGAIPLDLPAIGVDFYAIPGQKWLCGPEGVGALFVRDNLVGVLQSTFAGYASMGDAAMFDLSGYFMPAPGARRYEVATIYRPAVMAMVANLRWLEETVGWEWIFARIAQITEYAHASLKRLPGVKLVTPPGPQAGLVTFNLTGYDPARVVLKLSEENIVVRYLPDPYYSLRISTGFYNTEAEIDRLLEALRSIQASDPESLPQYDW